MPRVELLDSTLRDGAQGEGVSFSLADKAAVARELDALGVDIIEAGNPASNPKDLEFFRDLGSIGVTRSRLAAFGSTRRPGAQASEDEGMRALLSAGTETVVIFGKSWDLHVKKVLRTRLDENLAMIQDSCSHLKASGRRVIYDAEHFFDGWAADREYALKSLEAAAAGGAERIVLCDTNGGSLPGRISEAVSEAARRVATPLGIHAHDDSGLAVANSLAAVAAGAMHVQGTLVGFGERCGNANLSTIAGCLRLKLGLECLDEDALPRLATAVRRVSEIANVTFDESMPFFGRRAFAHKAGMHVDAVAKDPSTFEHVCPESVGNERRFLASEVGGRSVIFDRVRKLEPGATKDSPLVSSVVAKLKEKEAAGYQDEGAEASLELLARKSAGKYKPFFELGHYGAFVAGGPGPTGLSGSPGVANAIVKLSVDGSQEISAAEGDGPVNALDAALRRALCRFYPSVSDMRLTDYKVRVIDGQRGTAAAVRVLIESSDAREAWTTVGVSTDIIEASWIALVDSIEYKLIKDIETRYKTYI
jgi:2-isopropylmalate synthase